MANLQLCVVQHGLRAEAMLYNMVLCAQLSSLHVLGLAINENMITALYFVLIDGLLVS